MFPQPGEVHSLTKLFIAVSVQRVKYTLDGQELFFQRFETHDYVVEGSL